MGRTKLQPATPYKTNTSVEVVLQVLGSVGTRRRAQSETGPARARLGVATAVALLAAGCGGRATPAYFVAPTAGAAPVPAQVTAAEAPSQTSTPAVSPTAESPSPTPPCTDGLTYLQDLTIPDGTVVVPGQLIDKRWQVSNSGTCNWDDRYQLKLVGGDAMDAFPSLPLFPARAGAEATIRILFTAPQAPGTYESQWQAVNPDQVPFGNAFYMQIVVAQ